ncbi:HNH endonuclease signature motif containing protein [Sphaerochaeta sp. PS]|uniref:HNH endonuclease n=1 Tax=Sphaerochaeta sp. PS TaxID=3076336 RepID=UPI0028A36800|nr:HNH endonuclease signature motif containing protein [Sphaerochaeta sp. PS]MDT4763287.1 HNH endonuclease signature motif containing protein [Sphaerochaeta sp. PS]
MNSPTPYTQALINTLVLERRYTSEELAYLIAVAPESMLRRGVITKAGENLLIIFITLEKRSDATPYKDRLDGSVLHWEGQMRGKHAERYMSEATHEVFVFIREQPRTPYTYYGRAIPIRYRIHAAGTPSQVELNLYEYEERLASLGSYSRNTMASDNEGPYALVQTEKRQSILARTAQGLYREKALKLWNYECAVTQVQEPKILIASHIKPWRESSDQERVDARNSLILSPTYDKLFDLGFISFKPENGKILLSSAISSRDWEKLKVDDSKELKMIPEGTEHYLAYHFTHIFGFTPGRMMEEELLTF